MLRTWNQLASSGTFGSLCFNESKARDFDKLTDLFFDVECISRKTQQGIGASLVETCLEMCAADVTEVYSPALFNERSMQLGLSTVEGGGCRT